MIEVLDVVATATVVIFLLIALFKVGTAAKGLMDLWR